MRLHVLSDMHLEVRRPTWKAFVESIPRDLADVLVLAGDILCVADVAAHEMLSRLRDKAPEVVWVLGNHEHYHGVFQDTLSGAAEMARATGVTLLDGGAAVVAGRRFVGGTLWFRRDVAARAYRHQMMDFHLIEGFEDAVYGENARHLEVFGREVRTGDIVVSHHLPHPQSVDVQFREGLASRLNPFFLCDCEALIEQTRPAVWIHGHTHTPCQYVVGDTRVICNPIGYPRERATARLDCCVEV
jgi:Icc-related predicted phosphoesterase